MQLGQKVYEAQQANAAGSNGQANGQYQQSQGGQEENTSSSNGSDDTMDASFEEVK